MNSWPPYSDGCVVGKRQKNRCQKQRSWVVMEINHAGIFMVPLAQRAISDGTSLQDNVRNLVENNQVKRGELSSINSPTMVDLHVERYLSRWCAGVMLLVYRNYAGHHHEEQVIR